MNKIFEQGDFLSRRRCAKGRARSWSLWIGFGLIFALILGACGGGGAAEPGAQRVIPTMPAARFAQPTTQIGATAADESEDVDAVDAEAEDAEAQDAEEADVDAAEIDEDATDEATPEPEEEAAEEEATPTPEPVVDLERGANMYQVRGCNECHGEQAEGVPGEGSALAGLTLSEREFTTVLRTGGGGELGSGHLYGPSTISPGGMSALYAWLESLEAE